MLKRITLNKYIGLFIVAIVVVITGIILSRYIYMTKEHIFDLQLHGSYSIDTSGIREYVGVKENVPFTYFLQINSGNSISKSHSRDSILKDYRLELPDRLIDDIVSSDKGWYVLLSIGRELKEVKYKFLSRYSDGITSEAFITFCEEYKGDMMYVYFMNKQLYFMGEYYYIMNDDEKIFLGNDIRLINWGLLSILCNQGDGSFITKYKPLPMVDPSKGSNPHKKNQFILTITDLILAIVI